LYQLKGIDWLISRFNAGHGCILADEMGLGKTCQVCCSRMLVLYWLHVASLSWIRTLDYLFIMSTKFWQYIDPFCTPVNVCVTSILTTSHGGLYKI